MGQGEGAGQGAPLQTFGLVGLQLHHLHSNMQFLEVSVGEKESVLGRRSWASADTAL